MENNQGNSNQPERTAAYPQPLSATLRRNNGQMAVKKEYQEKQRQREYNTPVGVQYSKDLLPNIGQGEKDFRAANQIEGSSEGAE